MSKTKKTEEALDMVKITLEIARLAGQIGWCIAIPDKDAVNHIIIGKKAKLESLSEELEDKYTLMEKGSIN